MSISEGEVVDILEVTQGVGYGERQKQKREIIIDITKLIFCLEATDDLIEHNEIEGIKFFPKRMEGSHGKILPLSLQMQKQKASEGETSRNVRKWKRNLRKCIRY